MHKVGRRGPAVGARCRALPGTAALLLWTAILSVPRLHAQPEFRFSGYVVDFPSYQRSNELLGRLVGIDRDQFVNVTRLRVRPSLLIGEDGQLSLEYEISSLYRSAELFLPLEIEKSRRQLFDLMWNPVSERRFSVLHFIDRLHYSQGLGYADIVVGRQRISWGTGRIWNPTDLFNPINPVSFAKFEKDGADALLLKFHLGRFSDLSLVYNPQEVWQRANSGFRFRTNFREYDVSIMGGRFDRRTVFGGDFAGNFFGAGLRGEWIASFGPAFQSSFTKFIIGLDHQFSPTLYGLVEYHFNGEGKANSRSYELGRLIAGEILNLGRTYIAVQAFSQVSPRFTASAGGMLNMGDRSTYLGGSAAWTLTDELALALGGQIFLGDEFDEYWYYPHVLYLKIDLYF